jgi:hypothetical protein
MRIIPLAVGLTLLRFTYTKITLPEAAPSSSLLLRLFLSRDTEGGAMERCFKGVLVSWM